MEGGVVRQFSETVFEGNSGQAKKLLHHIFLLKEIGDSLPKDDN